MSPPPNPRLARRNAAIATTEGTALYMRYLGVLAVLGEAGACLHHSDISDEVRERIEQALNDAADNYPLQVRRVGGRYDIEPEPT